MTLHGALQVQNKCPNGRTYFSSTRVIFGLCLWFLVTVASWHNFHVVSLIILQAMFGQASSFNPRNSCVRAFYFTVLFAGIVGMTTFTAFYIKSLTLPIYSKQIETIEEIVSQGFELCGQNETIPFYNHQQDAVRIVSYAYTPTNTDNVLGVYFLGEQNKDANEFKNNQKFVLGKCAPIRICRHRDDIANG